MTNAEETLRAVLEKIVADNNYVDHDVKIKAITSGGANYTSTLFVATITAPGKDDLHLFAKVAIVGEKLRALMNATNMFETEEFFYRKLDKSYKALEEKHGVPEEQRFVSPKFYESNSKVFEETVVLENLVAKGYSSYDRFKSLDWDHAASAVEALAKFHALSYAYEKENPEEFEEVTKKIYFRKIELDDTVRETYQKVVEKALKHLCDEHKAIVGKYLQEGGDGLFHKYNQPMGHPVIIHGDYRASNLLFKREGNKVSAIPVDYQTLRIGSGTSDFVYFVAMGTDADFRAEHFERLTEHYYQQLALAMSRLGVDATEVYPKEEFDKELKEMLPYAVLLGISLLPVVLVEAEHAPRTDGDSDLNNFLTIDTGALFAERFTGLVRDCISWGVI